MLGWIFLTLLLKYYFDESDGCEGVPGLNP